MKILITALAAVGLMALVPNTVSAGLDDAKAQELLSKGGCTACHALDKKSMGPSFKDVAQKRKGQADAAAVIEKNIRAGSKGVYGAMPMPPVPSAKLGDGDLHNLVEWVLTK